MKAKIRIYPSRDNREHVFLIHAVHVACLVLAAPLSAQERKPDEDQEKTIRRQEFDTLEAAVARAEVELARKHRFGVATVIYSARTPDDAPFRGRVEFRHIASGGGYIPGELMHGQYIMHPTFILRSNAAAELHIIVPGYERHIERMILETGDMLILDDIVLQPLTARNTGTIYGRVQLELPNKGLDGIPIMIDNDVSTLTDVNGNFVARQVRTGNVSVSALLPGFVGMSADVQVGAGMQQSCSLDGYRKRYARVRWAYQPDGSRSFEGAIKSGEGLLMAQGLHRVSIARGFVKEPFGRSDFLTKQEQDRLIFRHFDVRGQEIPASQRITGVSFDDLREAPESGYGRSKQALRAGDLFAFRTYVDGHYAKMEVLEVTDREPALGD